MVFLTTWEKYCLFWTPKVLRKLYIQRNIALERDTWKHTGGRILIARAWIGRKVEKITKHALWRDSHRALNVREPCERLVKRYSLGFVSNMRSNTLSSKTRECCLKNSDSLQTAIDWTESNNKRLNRVRNVVVRQWYPSTVSALKCPLWADL